MKDQDIHLTTLMQILFTYRTAPKVRAELCLVDCRAHKHQPEVRADRKELLELRGVET